MKTLQILSLFSACLFSLSVFSQTPGPVTVPPNSYAFYFTGAPQLGLFFNSTDNRYEFRDAAGLAQFWLNPNNGTGYFSSKLGIGTTTPAVRLEVRGASRFGAVANYGEFTPTGDLKFIGTSDYLVGNNRYAFRAESNENYGLFFNSSNLEYEFRNGSANRVFGVKANTGDLFASGAIQLGNTSTSTAGTIRWNGTDFQGNTGGVWRSLTSAGATGWSVSATEVVTTNLDHNVGIGTISPTAKLDVVTPSTSLMSAVNGVVGYSGTSDIPAIRGYSITAPGWGIGSRFTGGYMGIRSEALASTYTGTAYGIYATAEGSAGTRIGVYGSAGGIGADNWGGYFLGKSYMHELRIGSTQGAAGYLLSVDGKIMCEELRVQNNTLWPDFVFEEDYELPSLQDVKKHVNTYGHLPGMPSAEQVCEEGFSVGDVQVKLLQKVEELTLYVLQQEEELAAMRALLEESATR